MNEKFTNARWINTGFVHINSRSDRMPAPLFRREFEFDGNSRATFDWMAKNKVNYLMVWMKYYDKIDEELKAFAAARGIIIESGHHNFDYLIPPEKYRDTHPEFFAVTDENTRRVLAGMPEGSRQLCVTNSELRKELVKNLITYHRNHPEIKFLGFNPNDGFGWCECENCSKLYDKNVKGDTYCRSEKHYRANRIFNELVSFVGKELHAASPELVLNFFAYVNYTCPAENFKLTPGISVHLAFYWRCINHLINSPECNINSGYLRDLLAWERAKQGGFLNIYEYFMGINFYLSMPMIHMENMFKEVKFYSQHQVDGLFTQFWFQHWSVYGVNYCCMARAARGEESSEYLERFYTTRFGAAADAAKRFYGKLQELLASLGECHIPHLMSFLCRVKAEQLEALRPDAAAVAAGTSLLPGRAFPVWVEYMIRFKRLYDLSLTRITPEKEVREFLQWIHEQQELKLFAGSRFDRFIGQWLDDLAGGRDWRYFTENDWYAEYPRHPKII